MSIESIRPVRLMHDGLGYGFNQRFEPFERLLSDTSASARRMN